VPLSFGVYFKSANLRPMITGTCSIGCKLGAVNHTVQLIMAALLSGFGVAGLLCQATVIAARRFSPEPGETPHLYLQESLMPLSPDPTFPHSPDLESTEARMRRALGLAGGRDGLTEQPRPEQQRPKPDVRSPDRPLGDRPRKRFVQDGDVPVTYVSRHRHDESEAPTVNPAGRIGFAEAALASAHAARERAERSLQEALATIRDLQTTQGHAELARREASEAARAAHDATEALRAEHQEREVQLTRELTAERSARVGAEAALQDALVARRQAEQKLQAALVTQLVPEPNRAPVARATKAPATTSAKTTGKATPAPRRREPQPVKWWLKTAKKP